MTTAGANESASPLLIRLLGPIEVRRDGERLPPLRTRKGLWLLALLTLHHGRPLDRQWVAGTLWPDSPEPQALYNLRIVFAEAGTGAYLADVEVTIAPIGPGPSYGPFREAGPLLYVVVKPGTYRIHATYGGLTRTADVKVGKGTAALTLYWPQTPG